jgi:hypothetical protein
MKLLRIIKYFRHHRERMVKLLLVVLGAVVAIDALIKMLHSEHAHTWVESNVPGFWALFGLIGCIVLILFSKWFGHLGIMTREDYYDE